MTTQILTPVHEKWPTFCQFLFEDLGESLPGSCDSTLKISRALIESGNKLGEIDVDVEASLEWFQSHGGYCDCEVLCSVDGAAHEVDDCLADRQIASLSPETRANFLADSEPVCTCTADKFSDDSLTCPSHGDDLQRELELQHRDEIAAENAWRNR